MRKDGTMKFDEDFDFETANAQFHKDEIDKEFQNKLKLKGNITYFDSGADLHFSVQSCVLKKIIQMSLCII